MAARKPVCALILKISKAARFSLVVFPAANVQGAITGTSDVRVTHVLYADDVCLISNQPEQLQLMLDRLRVYAQRIKLVINMAKPARHAIEIKNTQDHSGALWLHASRNPPDPH
eukprot:1143062-Pelagomonas_calceolata.AAC.2